jgi:methylmalonyl-CoA/ethylmalonyl-CoA epimerase
MKMRIHAMALHLVLLAAIGVILMSISFATAQSDRIAGFEISHHHVGISVPNAEESAAWYKKMLGFEVVARMTEDGANKMKIVHIKRGNCYIELFQVEGAKPLPDYRRDPSEDFTVHGLKHMAFQVADVQAAVKELKAKGADIAMGPVDTPGVAFVFIRDNAGNPFELIQYKKQ